MTAARSAALWRHYEAAPDSQKAVAAQRLAILTAALELTRTRGQADAFDAVATKHGVHASTIRGWYARARRWHRADWLAALLPRHTGRTATAEVSVEAWDVFLALYLRKHGNRTESLTVCHRRVAQAAREHGWAWPSARTVARKVAREIPRNVIIKARESDEAFDRTFPPMDRDRSGFVAMEAVNADGVQFKPLCLWPDGEITHVKVWIQQDLYSGKLLAWRADKTENKHAIRLAFGDLIERFGIPDWYVIDNTTAAASKWLTGGTPNRYRWKIRDDDPLGIIPQVGTRVRFVTPNRGQTKPVERANRDLRARIDAHPKFHGRGTKARPIPVAEFLAVMEAEFRQFNAQENRRGKTARGSSFDAVFDASYAQVPVRKATAEQRRLYLLAAEKRRAHRDDGSVTLGRGPQGENRYWCRQMGEFAGQWLVVRFDPARLHEAVHVYALDGRYIGEAPCTHRGGFHDMAAQHALKKDKKRYTKHVAAALEIERRMSVAAAVDLLPAPDVPPAPQAGVVRITPRQAVPAVTAEQLETHNENFGRAVTALWEEEKSRQA